MRLLGMCERAASPWPLGIGVVVPESVPLTVNFDLSRTIGRASLRRDEDGNIWADAYCRDDDGRAWSGALRYFAIGVRNPVLTPEDGLSSGRVTVGEIAEVAVVERNDDPDLPPYEVAAEPAR